MVNDTRTLNGALAELGETMASNLTDMGIENADAENGLTTLANKILEIEPSVAGLELATSMELKALLDNSEEETVFFAKLLANYDDTELTDVDLQGVLTGATIKFMDDETVIGTSITDSNGETSFKYNNLIDAEDGSAIFEGTNNFVACTSNVDTTIIGDMILYTNSLYPNINGLIGNNIIIDWGDGTVVEYNDYASHSYGQKGNYIIGIRGNITGFNDYSYWDSFTEIHLPNTLTSIGRNSMDGVKQKYLRIPGSVTSINTNNACQNIGVIEFEWTGANIIQKTTVNFQGQYCWFIVPIGSKQDYVNANYPSAQIFEKGTEPDNLNVSNSETIIVKPSGSSFANSTTLNAKVTKNGENVSGVKVSFQIWYDTGNEWNDYAFENQIVTTNSNGEASYTYTAQGAGKIKAKVITGYLTEEFDIYDSEYGLSVISNTNDIIACNNNDMNTTTITAKVYNTNLSLLSNINLSYEIIDNKNNILDAGNIVTNSLGEATFDYEATGAGDVTVIVKYNNYLYKTYNIVDYAYYSTEKISSTTELSIPNMPKNFEATWTLYNNGSNTNSMLQVGKDNNNNFYVGRTGWSQTKMIKKINGVDTNIATLDNAITSVRVKFSMTFTYIDGVLTLISSGRDSGTRTLTGNYILNDRDYINYIVSGGSYAENLKIKKI